MDTTQDIQSKIEKYIVERIDFEHIGAEINLFEDGLVNSLFAIELMTFLEKTFDIKIGMADLDMAHYQSINAITSFVQRKEMEKIR